MSLLDREKFIKDLSALIGFPTVTGEGKGFDAAFSFIKEKLHRGSFIEILQNEGETVFIASNVKTKKPDICYLVHADVVSANPHQFEMAIEDGMVIGRGVSDMKFSIPIGYELLNHLIERKSSLSFAFVVTSDEERGGFKGAQYLADVYKMRPKVLIVPDGGDNFGCIHKSKGVCHLKISSVGIPAHASRPWDGKSALEPLIALASKLYSMYQEANANKDWRTTMNIGKLMGGEIINQVPGKAEMLVDFRFVPETDSEEKLSGMVKELAQEISANISVEMIAYGEPVYVSPEDPTLKMFIETMRDSTGREIPIEGSEGSTDARHLAKHGAVLLMSKPNAGGEHGDREWLDIDSALKYGEVLAAFLERYETQELSR